MRNTHSPFHSSLLTFYWNYNLILTSFKNYLWAILYTTGLAFIVLTAALSSVALKGTYIVFMKMAHRASKQKDKWNFWGMGYWKNKLRTSKGDKPFPHWIWLIKMEGRCHPASPVAPVALTWDPSRNYWMLYSHLKKSEALWMVS